MEKKSDKDIIISSQQETTIDYPGKMAIIVFTPGCNFKCKFCHNPELVFGETGKIDVNILLKNIENRKNAGWYEGVCISGGEPTLQEEGIYNFTKKLKSLGLLVKLDTNGSNPELLKKLIGEDLVDYIAMDIKSDKEKYKELIDVDFDIEKISESIKIIKETLNYEFRTTVLPCFTKEDIEEIGKWVSDNMENKVKLFSLQQFVPKNTLDPEYMKLSPTPKERIEEFAAIMNKYAENVRVLA